MEGNPERRLSERRGTARQKSFLRGLIYFNNRRNVVDCLVRDISPYGARLIFSDAVSTPDILDLYIPQKEQTLRAHVHWRHGQEVGVAFSPTSDLPGDAGNLAERVQKLEVEIANLKRMLKKMKAEAGPEPDAA
jgi:hypothetical protein